MMPWWKKLLPIVLRKYLFDFHKTFFLIALLVLLGPLIFRFKVQGAEQKKSFGLTFSKCNSVNSDLEWGTATSNLKENWLWVPRIVSVCFVVLLGSCPSVGTIGWVVFEFFFSLWVSDKEVVHRYWKKVSRENFKSAKWNYFLSLLKIWFSQNWKL